MIYLIQSGPGGPVKIGTANDPKSRIRELQTGCPNKIRALYTLDGGRELETELHHQFAEHRTQGEWFKPSHQLFEAFAGRGATVDSDYLVTHAVSLEPALLALAHDAWLVRDEGSDKGFCLNDHWYGPTGFKRRINELVGANARDLALKTDAHYSCVYQWLIAQLPPCRQGPRCGCIWP